MRLHVLFALNEAVGGSRSSIGGFMELSTVDRTGTDQWRVNGYTILEIDLFILRKPSNIKSQ